MYNNKVILMSVTNVLRMLKKVFMYRQCILINLKHLTSGY